MRSSKEEGYVDSSMGMERGSGTLAPTYSPSLVFSHGKKFRDQTFCTLYDNACYVRSVPDMRQMDCVDSSHGWLLMKHHSSTQCYLFNPISSKRIHLPPLSHITYNVGVLTSPPNDSNCVVMFVSGMKKSCIFCRPGDKRWIEQDLEPNKKKPKLIGQQKIYAAISCKGKIYVILFEEMVVIDVHDTYASIKLYTKNYLNYSISGTVQTSWFHVESCGEIFFVRGLHLGILDDVIQALEVFKLDSCQMVWMKVENLGDRIFLLGTSSSASISATESDLKGNCIYFFHPRFTSLYIFDMDDKSIKITQPCPKVFHQWRGPFWVVPNCKVQVKQEVAKIDYATDVEIKKEEWSLKDLPTELLELIFSFLFLDDCIRFRLTCNAWMSITPPVQSNLFPIKSKFESQQLPWLLFLLNNDKDEFSFNHPIYSDTYLINIPELAGAIIRHAKYGWLLMSRGKRTIFFLNPYTMETIKLPDLTYNYGFVGISFTSPPTSSDCIVFGHYESHRLFVKMLVYRKGEDTWHHYFYESEGGPKTFMASYCNPVFYGGVFYCLAQDGKLGCFNPKEGIEEELVWRVLPKIIAPALSISMSYIVECDGELLSVFIGRFGNPVNVFKLDFLMMKWVRLESLGDKVLLLSHTTSMLVPAGLKGIENRIYFPRFHEKECLFYSLRTRTYHSFGSKDSDKNWSNTWKHWNLTWFSTNSFKEDLEDSV